MTTTQRVTKHNDGLSRTWARLACICICTSAALSAQAAETSVVEWKKLSAVTHIIIATYPSISAKDPTSMKIVKDQQAIAAAITALDQVSHIGSISKSWPDDIPIVHFYFMKKDQRFALIELWNHRLQLKGGYTHKDWKDEQKAVAVLEGL